MLNVLNELNVHFIKIVPVNFRQAVILVGYYFSADFFKTKDTTDNYQLNRVYPQKTYCIYSSGFFFTTLDGLN